MKVRAVVGFLCVAIALGAFVLVRRTPTWFAPPARDDAAAIDRGERLESALIEQFTRVRAPDASTWSIAFDDDAANAWLATRLPRWIEHFEARSAGGPRQREVVQLRFLRDAVELGLSRPGTPFASATLAPRLTAGELTAPVTGGGVASVRLPGGALHALVGWLAAGDAEASGGSPGGERWRSDVTALLRGESVSPSFDLGDGRSVELLDLEIHPGELRARLRTRRSTGAEDRPR
ncbi:MAG TPA: hypothetical protein PKC43_10080 [Phycisphaerales bacterium]|nr:hypothetical protein [Phycisphaerales bacterium]HMP37783.1 hypothetical protein [Phycisphaerales bacterium]